MKKILATILSIWLLLFPVGRALAANTNSISLVAASSQYLSITDADQTGLDVVGNFSIEAWIKITSLTDLVFQTIVSKTEDNSDRSYLLRVRNNGADGEINFLVYNGSYFNITRTVSQFSSGVWYHIAVTYSTAGEMSFYLDTVKQGITETGGITSILNSTRDFFIGKGSSANPQYMDGLIDDVRVWSSTRTATEISDNYQKELTGSEANLVGYWKLNNDLLDATANNNDLTNNNSATFSTDVPFTGATPKAIKPPDIIFFE